MPARQVRAITELVGAALQRDTRRIVDARALLPDADGRVPLAEFVDHIVETGRRAAIAYLRRTISTDELRSLLSDGALPAVIVHETPAPGIAATVLLSARNGRVQGRTVVAGGGIAEIEGSIDEIVALAFGDDRYVACLTPLPVTASTEDDASGHHGSGPTPFRRLLALLDAEKGEIGIVYLYAALAGVVSLSLPLGIQSIIGVVSGGLVLQPVVILIGVVVLGTTLYGVLQVLQLAVVERLQQRVFARLSLEFAFRLPRVRFDATINQSLPELTNRFFELVTIQKSLAKLLMEVSTALLTVLAGLLLLTLYHPYFTVFGVSLVVLLGLLFWITGPRGLETSLAESAFKYRAAQWLEEIARALTAFKYAGRSNLAVERMDHELGGYLEFRRAHFRVLITQSIAFVVFKTLITGAVLILGTMLVIDRQITLGQFVASEIVIVTVLAGVEKMVLSLATVYDLLTSVEKAGHLRDLPLEPSGGVVLPRAPQGAGMSVTARDLGFTFPGAVQAAVSGVSMDVAPGEKVGITGYFGSGQTTTLRILGGVYDGYVGALGFDGVPMRDLDRAALRDEIGQYLSNDDLFEGTVEENIAVGRSSIATGDVIRALYVVGLGEWLQSQPHGLSTRITNAGRGLPSTVVVKLLLAQAIAVRPRLLLFDDFLGTIEADVRDDLVRLLTGPDAGWTLLVATHDAELLQRCDRILLLDDGQVRAVGSYAELDSDPYFRRVIATARVEG
jgi:ABC-type bacteriocin/lantibiotic exporter with double-glycine peptidase domain